MPIEPMSQEILAATTDVNLKGVDLTNCDREPIHIPNLIQPHGVLLVISQEYKILQVSLNTKEILGIEPQELLDKPLMLLLGEKQVESIQRCLANDFEYINPLPFEIVQNEQARNFDGIVHQNAATIVLELEPTTIQKQGDFVDFYRLIKSPVSKLQKTTTFSELCDVISQEVKKITGFDRVMVYRFNQEGSGKIIAEAAEAELEPFLGLNYPATDIPQQAKYLYTLNLLRLIPDVGYEPVGIIPHLNPLTNQPLDMSMAALRSISPLHSEYLDNMGVSATLCISLVKNGQLWGLVACHHYTPKIVPYKIRTVCELIGQVSSFELAAKEDNQDSEYKMKLKSIQSEFVKIISQESELNIALTENAQYLLDLVGAGGAALSFGSEITLLGNTPDKRTVAEMLPWLETQFEEDVIFETNSLEQVCPVKSEVEAVASGLLALQISRIQKSLILWFRPEVIQTVDWGGNPNKPVEIAEDGTLTMSPRKSFAKWQETVRGKSLPWKACEVEAALELRSSIIGIVLRKADELTQVNQELARSNVELDAFAYIASHDLKEPLRGIYNYSSFLIEDYGETLGEDGADKLNALMRLTHRMEDLIESLLHYSRLGRAELEVCSVDLNDLVAGVLDVIRASARDTQVEFIIPRPLPQVNCDRTQINELFTNLISNGIKYNQQAKKIIEIGYLDQDNPIVVETMLDYPDNTQTKTIFYVQDNGIGIREKHLESIFRIFKRLHGQKKYGGGTGAGLTIAKKIVERHGGKIWVKSSYHEGSTFYFTLQ